MHRFATFLRILTIGVLIVAPMQTSAKTPTVTPYERWIDDLWIVETVYWDQREWPASNPGPKPPLAEVTDRGAISSRAERVLATWDRLTSTWDDRIDPHRLQVELDRIAATTKDSEMLERLFSALDRDPQRIALALALPTYLERLANYRGVRNGEPEWPTRLDELRRSAAIRSLLEQPQTFALSLPDSRAADAFRGSGCVDDTWQDFWDEPSPRALHTAVWTGSEMLIWGGENPGETYRDGGRYTPGTDSWIEMSKVGAPEGRSEHTAVWTGTEMIVWGGYPAGAALPSNAGGRYNPITDSWLPISTIDAPDGRWGHIAVWTGSEMIVWGGYGDDEVGDGAKYNPSTDSWSALSPLGDPEARPYATAVWTGSEMLVYGGGFDGASDPFELYGDGWRYNPSTLSWMPTTSFPGAPRTLHTAVWTGTEMIVWGGTGLEYDPGSDEYFEVSYDDGWRYNPLFNGWVPMSTAGNHPLERYAHTAVWAGDRMLIYGGFNGFDSATYSPTTDSWSFVPTAPSPSYELLDNTAVWTGSEVIVWGGFGNTGTSATGGRYNPSINAWTPTLTTFAPAPRAEHSAVWTGAELIVHGGDAIDFATTYRYDPALNSWSQTASAGLSGKLILHTAVWTGEEMIVWGGLVLPSTNQNDGGRYNPMSDSWTPANQTGAPSARTRHVADWTGTEMLIWGGAVPDSSGGRYNPSTDSWTGMSEIQAPSQRNHPAAVAASGDRFLIWGGYSGSTMLGDGAVYDWNADSWTPMTQVGAPTPRQRHTAIWSGSEMIVWGGSPSTANTGLDDGGRYDPDADSWQATDTTGAPLPRGRHSAVWTGSEMIVWGGRSNTFHASGGRYNPGTDSWVETTLIDAPRSRIFHTATWADGEMLIFGGEIGNRTPIGGRYCAASACTPIDWYRDVDGDGFGDPEDVVQACDAPTGYVDLTGDCDDSRADTWATPGPVRDLLLNHDSISGMTSLAWVDPVAPGASPAAFGFDLLRTGLSSNFTTGICVESADSDRTATDSAQPIAGATFYYLPRAVNACSNGEGSLGNETDGTPREGMICP